MAEASKTSFLGSISPWSRSASPAPRSPRQLPKDEGLKQSSGDDHTISLRPSPSLKRYPKDCPPLKTRWYYAVDVPKRKPFSPQQIPDEPAKPPPVPKKLVPFSSHDSQAIESAFQALDRDDNLKPSKETSTRVPVNEDYLYDVHIEKRELEPAYWLGPIYEVKRASWFYQEGSILRPCDENLANQLEEGYLKVTPWRKSNPPPAPRAVSQTRSRPTSVILDSLNIPKLSATATPPEPAPVESSTSNTYRLFGTHMGTTVTFQDATVAYLSTDDFMSRMSSTVYGRFGGYGGTKVVRGWSEPVKATEGKPVEPTTTSEKRKSARTTTEEDEAKLSQTTTQAEPPPGPPKRTALERQMSSLAGLGSTGDSDTLAEEEARAEEEREMEEARETDGEEQGRQIDHLVLITHGIGQRLGLRLDSINFIHDVNIFRKTMKGVFESAPDLQALSGLPNNCRIQVLPICWRHLLDFPKQSLKQNRKEFDLGDTESGFEEEYPSLQDITVEGVPAVRNLITDLAMDVLLYQSAYREHIASIVQQEVNRVYHLFKKRTGFSGKVSLLGHSLGSAILFDILCRQEELIKTRPRRKSSRTNRDLGIDTKDLKLDFPVESFFALGSPLALFQMLKGRTIAGRRSMDPKDLPVSPFDPDPMNNDPFESSSRFGNPNVSKELIPITTSSPKCEDYYNIFYLTDPIAYRVEPLISPAMAQIKSQALPYTKKGLFAAPGIANISARVGQQVMSSWYNLTSGVASTLINRSLGITGDEQALAQDRSKASTFVPPVLSSTAVPGSTSVSAQPTTIINNNSVPTSTQPSLLGTSDKKQQALAEATNKSTSNPYSSTDSNQVGATLIDSEIETLYSGFLLKRKAEKGQNTSQADPNSSTAGSPNPNTNTTIPSASNSTTERVTNSDTLNPNSNLAPPPQHPITISTSTSSSNNHDSTHNENDHDHDNDPAVDEYDLSIEKARKLKREEAKVKALNRNGRVDYHIQEGMFDVSLLASIASHLSYWSDEDVNHFVVGQLLKKTCGQGLNSNYRGGGNGLMVGGRGGRSASIREGGGESGDMGERVGEV